MPFNRLLPSWVFLLLLVPSWVFLRNSMLVRREQGIRVVVVAAVLHVVLGRTFISNPNSNLLAKYAKTDCNSTVSGDFEYECCFLKMFFDRVQPWNDTTLMYENSMQKFNVSATCLTRTTNGDKWNWIRVEAPGTPNHPYASPTRKVSIQNYDYLIKMRAGYMESSCSDDDDNSCDACDSSTLEFGVVGFALNGVAIFSPLSIDSVDPFYPPEGYSAESLDACGAHPQAGEICKCPT